MSPIGDDAPLLAALERAHAEGSIGPVPLAAVIEHSELFVEALEGVTGRVIDLGSGGGVPGLVIAWRRPDLRLVLVDRRSKRTDLLRRSCRAMGIDDRVKVVTGDVMAAGAGADAVVARLFAAPEVAARAASALVRSGGVIAISDAPDGHPWERTAVGGWPRTVISSHDGGPRVVRFSVP